MSAHTIFDNAPIGSIIAWSDGTPQPPARFRKKLAAWQSSNSKGRLIRKQGGRGVGNVSLSACFTLHEIDYGVGGVIAVRVHRTFSLESKLHFTVVERPAMGSVRVFDRAGDGGELLYLATNEADAKEWLTRRGYPGAVLQEVTADEVGADRRRREGSMNSSLPRETPQDTASGNPEVEYGRSAEGFLAARVDETAFAMLPARRGGHFLATGWRVGRSIAEWHRADFYGHSGALADESAFRSMAAETAEHQREKRALGRKDVRFAANTPWGAVARRHPLRRRCGLPLDRGPRRFQTLGRAKPQGPPRAALGGWLVRGRRRMVYRGYHLPTSLHRLRTPLRRAHRQGFVAGRLGGTLRHDPPARRVP